MTAAATARRPAAAHGGEIDILRSFARRIDPSDAGAYNNLGVLYFRKGLTDEAIVAFSRALALDERMGVARRNLEIAYGESGILERRLQELEERLRTHPDDLESLVQSGIAEKTAGRLEKAHSLFQRAIDLDPDSSVLHFLLAETLYNRGLHEDSMRSVRRSIELNPDNPDALYLLGFILGDLGRGEEAAEANRRAVMLNPTLVRAQANLSLENYRQPTTTPVGRKKTPAGAHITLGRALRQKGYFEEALREYERAIEGGQANAEVLQAMLELYLLQRDTGAAIATADRFAREFSPTAKSWNARGVALQLEGRHLEAEESYNQALALDSSYPYSHNNLGVLLWHKADTKGAINAFRRALQSASPPVEARLNLALGLFRRKHTELSLEAFRQVLNAAPEHPVAWNGIGLILVELDRYSDARNAFARAIQANPDFAEAHYNLSFTLSNLGDFTGALRETKRALSLDPMYTPQKLELAIELPHEEIRLTVAPPITESDQSVESVEDFHFDPAIIEQLFATKPPRPETATEDPMAGFALARDFITKGLYDRAQAEIARVLSRGGDKILGLVLAGDGFAAQGLHGEGLERYKRALEMEENNIYARQGAARSLLALGRADEARPYAEALVEAGSTDINLLLLAAEARVASLDKPGARDILQSLERSEARNANVLKRVGDLYSALGDESSSIAAYRASLGIDERQVDTRVALGRLLAKSGDDTSAIRELETALVTAPNHDGAVVELVGPYRRTGRSRSALPRVVALVRRDVYHFPALIALGEILIDLARESDALNAFERVLRFDPDHVEARRYRALLRRGLG
ncbi:MAG: tetratricopeptide repeat protein [Gemmatimonadaceae bacterium]